MDNATGNHIAIGLTNWWMWVALLELLIIVFGAFFFRKRKTHDRRMRLKKKVLHQSVDFNNIIDSSFNASALYNELRVKCHPDRFPMDEEKNRIATELALEIFKHKNDIKKLQELRKEASQRLNINL